jgi:hypothetical protein
MAHADRGAVTTEVHIRHCRIEVRPAAGSGLHWADAEAHHAFAQRVQTLVLSLLDELFAPYLAGLAPDEVPRSLVLDLRLRPDDLEGAAPLARQNLRDRAGEALAEAIARAPESEPAADPAPEPAPARAAARPNGADGADPLGGEPAAGPAGALALLLAWHRDRQLEYRLALFSNALLVRLIEAVLAELGDRAAPARAARVAPAPSPSVRAAAAPALEVAARQDLRKALHALVVAEAAVAEAAASRGRLDAVPLKRAIAGAARALRRAQPAALPQDGEAAAAEPTPSGTGPLEGLERSQALASRSGGSHPASGSARPAAWPHRAPRPPAPAPVLASPLGEGRYDLESALPFLALQRLAGHGILAAAAALNESCGEAEAIAALAYTIALRSQDLPAEAGRWSATQLADAARLAGRSQPPESAELIAAARAAGEICEAAAAAVGATLIAGHKAGLPLPLLADSGLLVVFESDGLYPICRLSGPRVAEAFAGRDECFFVAYPDPALLCDIDTAGLLAVAAGPPARGESWRSAVAGRGWRGMTNLAPGRFKALAPALPATERAARRASEIWQGLTCDRPLVPGSSPDGELLELDRTAALLAGFALADIAWTLCGREPAAWAEPDPLLTVERFADLSATLDVAPDRVTVTLPLGARFTHLRDAGLLETVGQVPWWPGRTIAFEGG